MAHRFAILKHDHPFLHWDLLLEEQSSARTWRLLRQPCLEEPIAAETLQAHRLEYLTYEGPVGQNRGWVQQVAAGTYCILSGDQRCLRLNLMQTSLASGITIETLSDGRVFVTLHSLQNAPA